MTRFLALERGGKYRWLRVRRTYFSLDSHTIYWWSWPKGLREICFPDMARRLGTLISHIARVLPFRAARQSDEMGVWDEHGLKGAGF